MRASADSASHDSGVPVCDLLSIPAPERGAHIGLARSLLFREGQTVTETTDDLAFELPAARFGDVARFVANERRCCAHLRFVIEVQPRSAPLLLRIIGPGVRDALEAIVAFPQKVPAVRDLGEERA
jgi:hypothetical protein